MSGVSRICSHSRGQDVGGRSVGQVRRRGFEPQLTELVGDGCEVVGEASQFGERGIRRRTGKRRDRCGADGVADHGARGRLIGGK